jgi:hypothetical protein
MSETKKNKRKPKPKPKPKAKAKPKPKPKESVKPKEKKRKPKEQVSKVIVQLEENKQEKDENVYTNKLKSLINKIKTQNEYTDSGIRFAWRN